MAEFVFLASPLLGARAEQLFSWFRRALHADGDVAECGVYAGDTSREFARYLEFVGLPKVVHMFDTFTGLPATIEPHERVQPLGTLVQPGWFSCEREAVSRNMHPYSRYVIHEGLFSDTFPTFTGRLCFIHADADLYRSTVEILALADRCLAPGGVVVFDDYGNAEFTGVQRAVDDLLDRARYDVVAAPDSMQCFATKRA